MMSCDTLENLQPLLTLAENHWASLSTLLTPTELTQLKAEAVKRWEQGQFEPAKVGRSQERKLSSQVRSDWTSWVDLKDPTFSALSTKIQSLLSFLNQNFYFGLQDIECHLARYSDGQFYQQHIDQSPLSSPLHGKRVISFVLYLNENWQHGDGGELVLSMGQKEIEIQPRWGNLVLFLSDTVPHAVLPALQERWSLTGWFRRS